MTWRRPATRSAGTTASRRWSTSARATWLVERFAITVSRRPRRSRSAGTGQFARSLGVVATAWPGRATSSARAERVPGSSTSSGANRSPSTGTLPVTAWRAISRSMATNVASREPRAADVRSSPRIPHGGAAISRRRPGDACRRRRHDVRDVGLVSRLPGSVHLGGAAGAVAIGVRRRPRHDHDPGVGGTDVGRVWLGRARHAIVDEAGQACAHHAVPLFAKVRRAVVVGDQQQLAPVVTLEPELLEPVMAAADADERFSPHTASVQRLGRRRVDRRAHESNSATRPRGSGCPSAATSAAPIRCSVSPTPSATAAR